MNLVKVLMLVMVINLTACSTTPDIIYKDRIVTVPKIVYKNPPPPPEIEEIQSLPIDDLNDSSDNSTVAKAYASSIEQLNIKMLQYKSLYDAYASGDKSAK